ncbi:lysophospholipid acyltransferase family protein [soil metagenome]
MLYWVLKAVLTPILRVVFRIDVQGLENIPEKGAAILAPNHTAFCDSVFLPAMVPRRVVFLAKKEYFTGRGLKGWVIRSFMGAIGMVPIDRTSGSAAKAAMVTGTRVLAEGKLLGIYPEGTRSPDGRLYRGKTGVARMALEARVPVIPVVLLGTERVQPVGRKWPRIHRIRIRIGTPLDFSRYDDMAGDRFVERSMTDELMYELMMLAGREYVDVYAAKVKVVMDRTGTSAPEAVEQMRGTPRLAA